MKIIKNLQYSFILGAILFSGASYAFEVGGARKNYCKPPQFREFSPPERVRNQPFIEVEPGSEIRFKAIGTINPHSIRVFAKKIVLKTTVVDRKNYFLITANLPAELTGYARIDLIAHAEKGKCVGKDNFGKDGWLIKIKEIVKVPEVIEPVISEEAIVTDETVATEISTPITE